MSNQEEEPCRTTPPTDLDPLDRIDRSIEIDAPAERVWDLVTRPGWWINEGAGGPRSRLGRHGRRPS